ncbi:hypothetical protein [Vampirovibrio sp.]|uniref:hypothetical protein n=1 Tax=Vampirovibrio sp. TaxID=2717857 RepID=UPI0035934E80
MRIPHTPAQPAFSVRKAATPVRFAANSEQTEIQPCEPDSPSASSFGGFETIDDPTSKPKGGAKDGKDGWEGNSFLMQLATDNRLETADSAEFADSAELIETPQRTDYVSWHQQQQQKKLEAIGRRFSTPGRALTSLENNSKSISRKLMSQTKELANTTSKAFCRNAAHYFRKAAQTLEKWQDA